MLHVALAIGEARDVRIKISFLSAHAMPADFKGRPDTYIDEVCLPALEAACAEELVDAVDGFGKLASLKIGRDDLARLQRNLILSYAAGVADPIPRRRQYRCGTAVAKGSLERSGLWHYPSRSFRL